MVVWVKIRTSLRLKELHRHDYNNKHVVTVVERSWKKEAPTIGLIYSLLDKYGQKNIMSLSEL